MQQVDAARDQRRHRLGLACVLGLAGILLDTVVVLWPRGAASTQSLSWPQLLVGLIGLTLALAGIFLALSVMRELRRL